MANLPARIGFVSFGSTGCKPPTRIGCSALPINLRRSIKLAPDDPGFIGLAPDNSGSIRLAPYGPASDQADNLLPTHIGCRPLARLAASSGLRRMPPLPLGWLRLRFAPAASPSAFTGREPVGLRRPAPSPAEPLMHSLFQLNLASPAKPSMSILSPLALASSGIFQRNNFRLASAFASSGASSDPSAACASGFTLCPGWRSSSGSHRLSTPSTLLAINFRLAPTVYSSSLPAPNSDALTGHQLKRQYVRSICGRKCKTQANLWISPGLVHSCEFCVSMKEFAAEVSRFDQ